MIQRIAGESLDVQMLFQACTKRGIKSERHSMRCLLYLYLVHNRAHVQLSNYQVFADVPQPCRCLAASGSKHMVVAT